MKYCSTQPLFCLPFYLYGVVVGCIGGLGGGGLNIGWHLVGLLF